jgi:hypothetical protein
MKKMRSSIDRQRLNETKKAPGAGQGIEGQTPTKGIKRMFKVHPVTATVDAVSAALQTVHAELEALEERRQALLPAAAASLREQGLNAFAMVDDRHHPFSIDDILVVQKYYGTFRGERDERCELFPDNDFQMWGPREGTSPFGGPALYDVLGRAKVIYASGTEYVLVWLDHDNEQADHHRAVARLRTAARRENFRVQLREREVTLVNPTNHAAHIGSVTTAFGWLLGLEVSKTSGLPLIEDSKAVA